MVLEQNDINCLKDLFKLETGIKKKNIDYITFLQSYTATLVVFGHSFAKEGITDWARVTINFLYSFHMPLFFLIAGFLFAYSLSRQSGSLSSFWSFLKNKAIRLLVPYFAVGSTVYFLRTLPLKSVISVPREDSLGAYVRDMLCPDSNETYLWFLLSIFVIYLGAYLIRKWNCWRILAVATVLSLCSRFVELDVLNLQETLYYSFYFAFGVVVFNMREKLLGLLTKKYAFLFLMTLFCLTFVLKRYFISDETTLFLVKYVVAIFGIVASFSLALSCVKKSKKFCWGIFDGKYYQLYLLAWFGQCAFRFLYQFGVVNYFCSVILMFLGGILGALIMTFLIEKYLPKFKVLVGLK